jgi:hypothetical protein
MTREAVATILRLERLASNLEQGRIPDQADAALFANAVRAVTDRKAASLDEAFGLATGRGQSPLQKRLALHKRDLHLRASAELLAPASSTSAQAQLLLQADERYRAGRWRDDRLCTACPADIAGTAEGHLWEARQAFPYIPQSLRALQDILAKRNR